MLHHVSSMSQSNKYEKLYQETRNCCGEPFPEIAKFFAIYEEKQARVLDLGCGQGRDGLMVARLGHSVLGVDASETGIRQMMEGANRENLDIRGLVADITQYKLDEDFNIAILDRVLHMLSEEARVCVLGQVIHHIVRGGFVLIADMPSNKPKIREVFASASSDWSAVLDKKGFLFVRRDSTDCE